jgi:chromate transport protein ChrA
MKEFVIAAFAAIVALMALLIIFLSMIEKLKKNKLYLKTALEGVGASLLVSGVVIVVTINFGQVLDTDIIWLLVKGTVLTALGLFLITEAAKK